MGNIFNKYILENSQAIAALEALKREVRELQGAEGSSQKTFDTNAQKRGAAYAEEEAALKELRRQREILLKKGTISGEEYQRLQKYNTEIEQSTKRLKKMGDQVDKVDGKQKKLNKTSGGFLTQLTKIGAAIGVAFGIREIVNFTKRAAELSAEAEGVRTAFERIGGTSGMLQDLQRATRGTVEQLELMRLSVQASHFNIPLEHLGNLFEFATNRAIETGQSVDKLVADITLGLGRKSMRVLDNLGLSWTDMQAAVAEAGDFTTGIINVINRDLGKMGDVADTNLTKIQRSQAALKDATIEFGDTVAPVYAGFLDLLSKALLGINALVSGMSKADQEDFAAAQERINFEMEGYRKAVVDADNAQGFFLDRIVKVQGILKEEASALAGIIEKFDQHTAQLDKMNPLQRRFAELVERSRKSLETEEEQITSSEAAYARILQANIDAAKAVKEKSEINRIEKQLLAEYQKAQIANIPVWEEQLRLIREGKLAGEEQVGVGRTLADIQEDIKNAQEKLNKEVGVGTAGYYQAQAALDVLNKELERWTENQDTLLEQLEKMGGGIKPSDGMEEWAAFMDSLGQFTDPTEGLEEFTAFIDGMDSEVDKIMALRSAIAGLGEDSPALKAALEGQLEGLMVNAEEQREGLLDMFARSEEEIAMRSLDLFAEQAEALLAIGEMTQEEYDAIVEGIKEKMAEIGDAGENAFASTMGNLSQLAGVFKDIYTAMGKDAEKNAQFLNALTTFQILLNQAQALSQAIASAKGVTAVDYAIQVAIAVATVVGAIAKAKAIQNQARSPAAPRFGYGGEVEGRPHTQGGVPINAEKGEYIVKSSAYAKAKEAVHAINSERFDTYVTQHYIEPLLKSKQLAREDNDRGFARNIAESLHLDGKAEHYLKQIARRGNGARIENWDELARLIKKDGRGSTY